MSKFFGFVSWGASTLYDIHKESNRARPQPAPPEDPSWVIAARKEIEAFFEEHRGKTVGDCEDEIRALIHSCNDKAYQNGGAEMFEGIKNNNPEFEWE